MDRKLIAVAGIGLIAWYLTSDGGSAGTLGFAASDDEAEGEGAPMAISGEWSGVVRWADLIDASASANGVSAAVLAGMIYHESRGNPSARNPSSSARGLTQMTKAAAQDVGIDWNSLDDPATAVEAGARLLAMLQSRYGLSEADAIAAYYTGPGNVHRGEWQARGASYASSVYQLAAQYEALGYA